MRLHWVLAGATPFALVLLVHYVRFASVTLHGVQPAGRRLRPVQHKPVVHAEQPAPGNPVVVATQPVRAVQSATKSVSAEDAAAAAEAAKRRAKCHSLSAKSGALSSAEATGKMLACAGLLPEPGVGLGEVLTADRIHELLPPGAIVWLTFSNYAYLHFAQNWWSQVRSIGRHHQVVVAALDPQTLLAWRELRVHVLDFTEFGDASDFRGIGADQARFLQPTEWLPGLSSLPAGAGARHELPGGSRCPRRLASSGRPKDEGVIRSGALPPDGRDEGQGFPRAALDGVSRSWWERPSALSGEERARSPAGTIWKLRARAADEGLALCIPRRSVLVSDVDTVPLAAPEPKDTDQSGRARGSLTPAHPRDGQVWTADPEPYLNSIERFDVGVTSDCLSRAADQNKRGDHPRFNPAGVWFCGHNVKNTFGATFNTGVLFLKPTPATLAFTKRWRAPRPQHPLPALAAPTLRPRCPLPSLSPTHHPRLERP